MNLRDLVNIFAWTLIILSVIFILWTVIGGSPTIETLIITMLSGVMFKLMLMGNDIAVLKEKAKQSNRRFFALANDFRKLTNELRTKKAI